MVYFITDGEYYKIGYSKNSKKRLNQLQTGNPKKLKIFKEVKGGFFIEKLVHNFFKNCKVKNEWYDIDNEKLIFDFINHLKTYIGFDFHSEKLSSIKVNEFGLVDYRLWDWMLSEVERNYNNYESVGVNFTYDKVKHLCKKSAYYASKSKLTKLKLIIKKPFKDYYILNPKYVIKLYNPKLKKEEDEK